VRLPARCPRFLPLLHALLPPCLFCAYAKRFCCSLHRVMDGRLGVGFSGGGAISCYGAVGRTGGAVSTTAGIRHYGGAPLATPQPLSMSERCGFRGCRAARQTFLPSCAVLPLNMGEVQVSSLPLLRCSLPGVRRADEERLRRGWAATRRLALPGGRPHPAGCCSRGSHVKRLRAVPSPSLTAQHSPLCCNMPPSLSGTCRAW